MRRTRACLFAFAIASCAGSTDQTIAQQADSSLDGYLKPQTLAPLPDGRHIHLFCLGKGSPVAIVAPGWHIPAPVWHRMQQPMAKLTRVCIYDRAGYSFSDPGPMPRDTAAETKDLHDALHAVGLKGPYVLIGHSLGGFDARLFAYKYPRETAGLLLLDPPTEGVYQHTREPDEDVNLMGRCAQIVRHHRLTWSEGLKNGCLNLKPGRNWPAAMWAKMLADQNRAIWYETLVSEDVSMVTRSADELVAARRPLGSIPLIVLQADSDCRSANSVSQRFDVARCAELERQARDSTRGERRIIKGASHMIQNDKPQVVLAAFAEIIKTTRASGLATAESH
ncbi:MAG TPA: alpha/beta hydrolase [Rhizomicrobium sp.]|jgi:pimeloyl-ACP methyl ester carboxylesterase|nr:alpha/beta hydrolase [Rhizomicrobium sp.]